MTAFYREQRYARDAFLHQQNPFARRNVTATVLEVPSELIGKGKINAWATVSGLLKLYRNCLGNIDRSVVGKAFIGERP